MGGPSFAEQGSEPPRWHAVVPGRRNEGSSLMSTASTGPESRYSMITATSESQLVGDSPAISELRLEIERTARSEAKVLITGESGVGKELVARAVHAH